MGIFVWCLQVVLCDRIKYFIWFRLFRTNLRSVTVLYTYRLYWMCCITVSLFIYQIIHTIRWKILVENNVKYVTQGCILLLVFETCVYCLYRALSSGGLWGVTRILCFYTPYRPIVLLYYMKTWYDGEYQ